MNGFNLCRRESMTDRLDRTRRFVERITGKVDGAATLPISLSINDSLTAHFLVDISARFASKLELSGAEGELAWAALTASAVGIAPELSIDGANGFIRVKTIGNVPPFHVGVRGWTAQVSRKPARVESEHPIGALTAAAMAAAEAFRPLVGSVRSELTTFSGWNYRGASRLRSTGISSEPLSIGWLVLVGVGAIGSGLLSCLAELPLSGRIDLVDPDVIDPTNLNRYVGIGAKDVGKSKVGVWAEKLASSRQLEIRPYACTYSEYRSAVAPTYPLVVVSTDNRESRVEVQRDLPKTVINAATDGAVLTVSVHHYGSGACLGCLYPLEPERLRAVREIAAATGISPSEVERLMTQRSPIQQKHVMTMARHLNLAIESLSNAIGRPLATYWAEELCGRVSIPSAAASIEGSAPFVSAMAGALACGEVIKVLTRSSRVLRNYFIMNIFKGPTKFSLMHMQRNSDCSAACYDPSLRSRYDRSWAPLSSS